MNVETIFTVKNQHLNRLDQNSAVEFCRKLLRAEAHRLNIELNKINISNQATVPDGGVDAVVWKS